MKILLFFAMALALQACRHPLAIEGEGDIIERVYGVRGCSYEEFQAESARCTENEVIGEEYVVSYQPKARPGWVFDRWEGTGCGAESLPPYCDYQVARSAVDITNTNWPGFAFPPTVAVFKPVEVIQPVTALDRELHGQIAGEKLAGDPRPDNIPSIKSPLAQLGMKLFFSKSLSGEFDTACASCHHPALAGADQLSLPIGTGAVDQDVMGAGRKHSSGKPQVGRNSPTTFNSALYQTHVFWDGRVARLKRGGISTPDSDSLFTADPNAGDDLLAAQARFPVDEPDEMRSHNFMPGADGEAVRKHLAARIGDYGAGAGEIANNNWLGEFEAAFGAGIAPEELITYENIALAISVYQQSQSFVNSPWKAYAQRDYSAISDQAKRGALLFLKDAEAFNTGEDGAGCSDCHQGDFFTNEEFDAVGVPQIGPGKGEKGAQTNDDLGRGSLLNTFTFDYRFRNPSLLNVEATAPYGHAGAYATLKDVVNHYADAVDTVNGYFANGGWCQLEQFSDVGACASLYPQASANTASARAKVLSENDNLNGMPPIELTSTQIDELVAFLRTLTDPCVMDRKCIAPWIPKPGDAPDGHQLNAVGRDGGAL